MLSTKNDFVCFDNFSPNPHVSISYLLGQEETGMWKCYKLLWSLVMSVLQKPLSKCRPVKRV